MLSTRIHSVKTTRVRYYIKYHPRVIDQSALELSLGQLESDAAFTTDLYAFFEHVPNLLRGPNSVFSFFNGLGATSMFDF
jgi:hypothetical protein